MSISSPILAGMKTKPPKPYSSFPLFAHSNGQWAKKIRGKLYYFGTWDCPSEAAELYRSTREAIESGRNAVEPETISLIRAIDQFLIYKRGLVESNELSLSTWKEYRRSCLRICKYINRDVACESLTSQMFVDLRAGIAEEFKSPKSLKNELTRIKVFLRWVYQSRTVGQPLPYELALKPPSMRVLRNAKSGNQLFTSQEIRLLLKSASGYLKPAILLGINSGFGNRDVCELQWTHLSDSLVRFPRNKTGVERTSWLWPETSAALAELRETSQSEWVCCGRFGQCLVTTTGNTPIAHEFRELMSTCGLEGRGFYCLRRTYRTVADEQGDQPAIMHTMGHEDRSMNGVYRQIVSPDRLRSIAEYVRIWLYT